MVVMVVLNQLAPSSARDTTLMLDKGLVVAVFFGGGELTSDAGCRNAAGDTMSEEPLMMPNSAFCSEKVHVQLFEASTAAVHILNLLSRNFILFFQCVESTTLSCCFTAAVAGACHERAAEAVMQKDKPSGFLQWLRIIFSNCRIM